MMLNSSYVYLCMKYLEISVQQQIQRLKSIRNLFSPFDKSRYVTFFNVFWCVLFTYYKNMKVYEKKKIYYPYEAVGILYSESSE